VSVKIRLRVVGKRKQHSYRIVAIESKNPRDGIYLEQLGWYNSRSKELRIDEEGIKKWQGKGAVLTDAVKALLKRTDENVSASKSAKASKKASKKKSKKQIMKETSEKSAKADTEESTGGNTEKSTDTGKTEEVNDVKGTDNLHSEVSGGSA
jgi:small subunit ribosomal protein S16